MVEKEFIIKAIEDYMDETQQWYTINAKDLGSYLHVRIILELSERMR